jgi:predicted phage-related endonuclease
MALIKYNTRGLTEKQWQDLRRTLVVMGKVGGSDAGTLLGLNEYTSPVILYYKALDIYPDKFKENELTFHGKHLEKYVADMWQYFDGTEDGLLKNFANSNKIKRYIKPNAIFENSKYPFLFANLDGYKSPSCLR